MNYIQISSSSSTPILHAKSIVKSTRICWSLIVVVVILCSFICPTMAFTTASQQTIATTTTVAKKTTNISDQRETEILNTVSLSSHPFTRRTSISHMQPFYDDIMINNIKERKDICDSEDNITDTSIHGIKLINTYDKVNQDNKKDREKSIDENAVAMEATASAVIDIDDLQKQKLALEEHVEALLLETENILKTHLIKNRNRKSSRKILFLQATLALFHLEW
mmetsp:Transcript_36478/g.43968  ORF Transcript_36478/g.43968 Transcript_36478/m.43968 type:complete len:223 (-) Transcript_36478:541-1209(-)